MGHLRLWVGVRSGLPAWGADLLIIASILAGLGFIGGSLFLPALWLGLGSIVAFMAVVLGSAGLLAVWKMRIDDVPRTWENWWSTTLDEFAGFGPGAYLVVGFSFVYLLFLESMAIAVLADRLFA